MKIGILTFHYATNYGAVIQAYALQHFLEKEGHEVEVIDYFPRSRQRLLKNRLLARRPLVMLNKLIEFRKETKINQFRKSNLRLSRRYESLAMLKEHPPQCDAYICGSDQIWNQHFTTKGEANKPTLTYFLDFGREDVKRISYAASFGCMSYPPELREFVKPALARFDAISVREQSGRDIIREIGFNGTVVVPDPTMLLKKSDYSLLFSKPRKRIDRDIFVYGLHSGQDFFKKVLGEATRIDKTVVCGTSGMMAPGIDGWLSAIANAKAVITNSFHGVVFSILFEKRFVAVPVEGKGQGMNDRLDSLLSQLGIADRILRDGCLQHLQNMLESSIDWVSVNRRVYEFREIGIRFLNSALDVGPPTGMAE